MNTPYSQLASFFVFFLVSTIIISVQGLNFGKEFDVIWGGSYAAVVNGGSQLNLSMNRNTGAHVQSRNGYQFGKIDMNLKLMKGNSAGTVVSFYLHSEGSARNEIDFEFLGNSSGQPYLVHTNIFINGVGNREHQYNLWFDPSQKFHKYTILWNPNVVLWYVDDQPIRAFKKTGSSGNPFPANQPMKTSASIWNGENWATRGGAVKIDWKNAPFTAQFNGYKVDACYEASSCNSSSVLRKAWYKKQLDSATAHQIQSFQNKFMVYNYCMDMKRFNGGLPLECSTKMG